MLEDGKKISETIDGAKITVYYRPDLGYTVSRQQDQGEEDGECMLETPGTLAAEEKLRWLILLTSGAIRQTPARLCKIDEDDNDAYCCLGVKATADGALVSSVRKTSTGVGYAVGYRHRDETAGKDRLLTRGLRRGMTQAAQEFFASLNDDNYTFAQIAFVLDVIYADAT